VTLMVMLAQIAYSGENDHLFRMMAITQAGA
jgi:hypothetical protein